MLAVLHGIYLENYLSRFSTIRSCGMPNASEQRPTRKKLPHIALQTTYRRSSSFWWPRRSNFVRSKNTPSNFSASFISTSLWTTQTSDVVKLVRSIFHGLFTCLFVQYYTLIWNVLLPNAIFIQMRCVFLRSTRHRAGGSTEMAKGREE